MVEMEELSAQSGKYLLMEMERLSGRAKAEDRIRASQLSCGLGLGDALQLPKEDIAGTVRLFQAPEASAVRRMRIGVACFYALCCRMR